MSFHFKIVSPERIVYEDMVDSVTVMTKMGEIGILPKHIPLVASLAAGELTVSKSGTVMPMVVADGLVEVQPSGDVTVLADSAEKIEEIDVERAEAARKRARDVMEQKHDEAVDYAVLSAKMEKELARLRVARKYRKIRSTPNT